MESGAKIVIALGHLGDEAASQPWTSEETISKVSDLDVFIDGHSHSTVVGKEIMDKENNPVLLTQTGEYFDKIGMLLIDGETGKISSDLISYSEIISTTELKLPIPLCLVNILKCSLITALSMVLSVS